MKTLKSTALTCICFLTFLSNYAQEAVLKDNNLGVLTFETEEIDYGTIKQHANGDRTFMFTNTGRAPIVISNVKTSCGCTVPSYAKTPIMPGETSEIKVHYATNRVGAFKKTITVISNAVEGAKTLRIKGEVLNPNLAEK